jgi:signal peptidase I
MRKFLASTLEVVEVIVIAVAAVVVIRAFLVQPFLVSGTSMSPNFSNGDYVLVDELTYRLREPERGEVVVFRDPQDLSTYFIKRIIGLPGETVKIADNAITVYNKQNPNGFALDESYLPAGTDTTATENCQFSTGTYSEGCSLSSSTYLVLGDNRPFSFDSRSWGSLPAQNIVGLVRVRLWPPTEITAFAAPKY